MERSIVIYPNQIIPILEDVIDLFLIPRFEELGMNASGEWKASLEVGQNDYSSYSIRGRDYTKYLVKGRPPNINQDPDAKRRWAYGMANSNPRFKAWLNARGLQEYGVQIAYKIADVGTNYYPNGTDLLEVLEEPQVIDFIQERLKNLMQYELKLHLQRQLQWLED